MSRTQSTIRTTISVMVLLMTINGASAQSVDIESNGFDIESDGADRIRIAGQLPLLHSDMATKNYIFSIPKGTVVLWMIWNMS